MCNLYNITTNQEAIRAFANAARDIIGNMEPSLDVYPDRMAPIVRNASDGVRELASVRWGMPSSSQALYEAATKRADKLRARGKDVDFDGHRKVNRHRSKMLRAAFAYAVCRRAIWVHICLASVLTSR